MGCSGCCWGKSWRFLRGFRDGFSAVAERGVRDGPLLCETFLCGPLLCGSFVDVEFLSLLPFLFGLSTLALGLYLMCSAEARNVP